MPMTMAINYNGTPFNLTFTADVADAVMLTFQDVSQLTVGVLSNRTFTLTPPAGVTIDPTAIPVFTGKPYPTNAITSNGDGTWNMPFLPTTEGKDSRIIIGTIVSDGTTYQIGGHQGIDCRFTLYAKDFLQSGYFPIETAGGTVRSYYFRPADLTTDTAVG